MKQKSSTTSLVSTACSAERLPLNQSVRSGLFHRVRMRCAPGPPPLLEHFPPSCPRETHNLSRGSWRKAWASGGKGKPLTVSLKPCSIVSQRVRALQDCRAFAWPSSASWALFHPLHARLTTHDDDPGGGHGLGEKEGIGGKRT